MNVINFNFDPIKWDADKRPECVRVCRENMQIGLLRIEAINKNIFPFDRRIIYVKFIQDTNTRDDTSWKCWTSSNFCVISRDIPIGFALNNSLYLEFIKNLVVELQDKVNELNKCA